MALDRAVRAALLNKSLERLKDDVKHMSDYEIVHSFGLATRTASQKDEDTMRQDYYIRRAGIYKDEILRRLGT